MRNIMMGFALAISMLTTLPFFKIHHFFKGINGYAVMFYPLIGFILGGILTLFTLSLGSYIPAFHLHILTFGLWVLLTGGLHLDGFSDTLDALFVQKDRAEEVMKDPHVGAMGMIFTGVFLIIKASALSAIEAVWVLPFILMLSRFNAVLAIYFFPYVRENGMSTLAKEEFEKRQLSLSVITVLILSLYSALSLILLGVSLLCLLLFSFWLIKRFGGFSGDLYGFMIEATELTLLHIVMVWSQL